MKGLSEVFLLVWVSGHQCQKWKRESGTDAKGVTGGASVSFVMDWIWGEGEGGATDSNRECRWRSRMEVEKANSNLSYLGHLWRDQGPKQASQPHRCLAD